MSPFTGSAAPTPDWRHLRVEITDGVATVTLARPDKLNALTFEAYADLRDLLAELSRRRSVRALVLAGEGRGFCSGGDVDEIIGATLSMDTARLLDFNRMTGQVVRAVRECPFPVIAALHGVAAGAGAVLALAADFRVADPSRPLRLPFDPRRPLRRRHGRCLPAAPRRRPRPRHPPADARRDGRVPEAERIGLISG
ncbi:enoyl-CoA hydratase family protein [Streptomyces violaceorubidus]